MTDAEIEAKVKEWHAWPDRADMPLHEFIGISRAAYAAWDEGRTAGFVCNSCHKPVRERGSGTCSSCQASASQHLAHLSNLPVSTRLARLEQALLRIAAQESSN